MIDPDQHVGERLIALDISIGISPCVEAVLPPSSDPEQIARSIEGEIVETLRRTLGPSMQFVLRPLRVTVHSRSGIIVSREERERVFEAEGVELRAAFAENAALLRERIAANPDNGRLGFWRVMGIRHHAIVHASSAPEAVEKAFDAEAVGRWEDPEADFVGPEMPEVWSPYGSRTASLGE